MWKKWDLALAVVVAAQTFAAAALAGTDFSQARQIVQEQALGGDVEGKRLYALEGAAAPSTVVKGWRKSVTLPSASGWVFFVDDMPDANWEHPARIIFVSEDSGERETFDVMTPPADFDKFREIGTYKAKPREVKQRTAPVIKRQAVNTDANTALQEASGALLTLGPDHKYAVLISGGYNAVNNHPRYWNDISFIYTTLKKKYGYKPDNIYVLFADGTSPSADNSDGGSSPTSLDGDKKPDINGAATKEQISLVFDTLQSRLTSEDFLFIFTTDHGGAGEDGGAVMYLWNDYITDVEFGVEVNKLTAYDTMAIAMEQCFSGGFERSLAAKNRVFISAASATQYSWAMGPYYQYDEFSYYLTCALANARPDGGRVNADADGDGTVSLGEAYAFACANDTADETPQFNDQTANLDVSGMMGANVVSLNGRFGLVFTSASSGEAITYNLNQKSGSDLAVYTLDCGAAGDKWQVSMGKKETMTAVGNGSTTNWFSPAIIKGNGKKTATITYLAGNDAFPASGLVKFVQPNNKKNQQLTVSR